MPHLTYTTEFCPRGSIRFNVRNPPAPGARLETLHGERLVFHEVLPAGLLACTRVRDSSQQLYFPVEIADVDSPPLPRARFAEHLPALGT